MLQWGFPQFYNQGFMQFPAFNMFSMPAVNPFMPTFSSIFNPFARMTFPSFSVFAAPQGAASTPSFNQYNFLNNQLQIPTLPKPQGIKSTISDLYDTAVKTTKKVVKKGKEYVKKGYTYIKQSVQELMKKIGYNAEKGLKLAQEAKKGQAGKFKGQCAKYVKKAIENAGLGKYQYNVNGKDMADAYGSNKNFKKISAKGINVKDLPAGCILCYDAGKSNHHKVYGHTGITLGNGTEVSDGLTRNPKEASYILVPV